MTPNILSNPLQSSPILSNPLKLLTPNSKLLTKIMASRKLLKKQINEVCGELFADCVALKMCEQCSDEVINQVMAEILQLRLEFVARISHTEKGSVRLFYKKLREEFTAQAEAISRKIIEA